MLRGKALVIAMCIGQIGSLLPHVAVPAVMAQHLIPLWQLSASEAGLMASSFAIGYMMAVPILTALTDRTDARVVLGVGSLLSSTATAAFGLFAEGLASASLIWGLAGIGFAGAYMPGLKALTDRLPPGDSSRSVTFYTASYSLGVGLSFLVAQVIADTAGWRAAFLTTAAGPLAMAIVSAGMSGVRPPANARRLLDFRPVLRNRAALGYILGYGTHCFEVYALRAWIVAFWTYLVAVNGGNAILEPLTVSVIVAVIAMPASILGNEAAIRFGRHFSISIFMACGGLLAFLIALAIQAPPIVLLILVLIYTLAIFADSGALTSGMSASAQLEFRGATMALHSTVGFGLSAAGAWAVGVALDAGGGLAAAQGWRAGFIVMAAVAMLGPAALWWSRR
ncbi:MAG: MFS transporter [Hyphomonadaceae bacterium]|nr:MFS transporter [Hyphomonadaceae bacterium]